MPEDSKISMIRSFSYSVSNKITKNFPWNKYMLTVDCLSYCAEIGTLQVTCDFWEKKSYLVYNSFEMNMSAGV